MISGTGQNILSFLRKPPVQNKSILLASVATSFISMTASAAVIAGWTITTAFPTGAGIVPTGVTYGVGAADQGE